MNHRAEPVVFKISNSNIGVPNFVVKHMEIKYNIFRDFREFAGG